MCARILSVSASAPHFSAPWPRQILASRYRSNDTPRAVILCESGLTMKQARLVPALLAAVSLMAHAQSEPRPKIVVVISVDQFSADLFSEYRSVFTDGLKRLQQGVVFPSGYQ